MGVAAHHFGGFDVERVGEGGAARAGHQLADEDDEEGHVAEFFNHVHGLAGADGVHEFVALLDDVFGQGFGRLRAVPRAAVGSDEAVDDFVEAVERGLRGGVGIGGGSGLRGAGIGHLGSLWVRCWKNGPTPDIARNMGDFKREGEMGRGRRRNLGRKGDLSGERSPFPSPNPSQDFHRGCWRAVGPRKSVSEASVSRSGAKKARNGAPGFPYCLTSQTLPFFKTFFFVFLERTFRESGGQPLEIPSRDSIRSKAVEEEGGRREPRWQFGGGKGKLFGEGFPFPLPFFSLISGTARAEPA